MTRETRQLTGDLYVSRADTMTELDGLRAEHEQLRAAVLAYDDAIRKASWRGQRTISDDDNLDELYAAMLTAAGRYPEAT